MYKQASIKQWDEDDVLYLITPACHNGNTVDGRVPSPKVARTVQVRKFSAYLIIALVGRQIGQYNHFKLDKGYFKVLKIYKNKWLISSMKGLLYVPSVTLHISTIMFQVSVALVQKVGKVRNEAQNKTNRSNHFEYDIPNFFSKFCVYIEFVYLHFLRWYFY